MIDQFITSARKLCEPKLSHQHANYFPHSQQALSRALDMLEVMRWREIKSEDDLPKPSGNNGYEQIDCLVFHNGEIKRLTWNCHHWVWDDESGDDFYCGSLEPTHYMRLLSPKKYDAEIELIAGRG